MSVWVFAAAAFLSLPKQFLTVYLGVALEQSENGMFATPIYYHTFSSSHFVQAPLAPKIKSSRPLSLLLLRSLLFWLCGGCTRR